MDNIKIGKREISAGLFVFLLISVLLGLMHAVESTSIANRLYEDLNFTVMQRSLLEAPRELPGILTVLFIGILNGLGDIRIAAIANLIGGVGFIFFGITPSGYFWLVLLFLVLHSIGMHLYMPLANTIAMTFAKEDNFGQILGRIQGLSSLSIIVSSGILFLLYKLADVSYSIVFIVGGCAMLLAGLLFFPLESQSTKIVGEKRFVLRKKFKMFYILSTINGARKQITLTFAPWLLITVFDQPVTAITALFFITCVISIFFKPWYGSLIDRRGEIYALRLEAIVMFAACLGFTFAKSLFSARAALIIVCFCYIIDKLMDAAYMARATYVKRLSPDDPADVARTLSMGLSMDHIISVSIPVFAGYAWSVGGPDGYMYVFAGGMIISILNFCIVGKLKYF